MTPIIMEVAERHLDEAAWFWAQWERALVAPDYDLAETAEVEERLLAHVDGLVEGGNPVAEALLWPALESEEPARVGAATLALLNGGLPAEHVRALLGDAGPAVRPTVQRALEICERTELGEALLPLLDVSDGELWLAALEVLVSREEVPSAILGSFLTQQEARAQIAVLRNLPVLPHAGAHRLLSDALSSPVLEVRDAAIEAGLSAGVRQAWEVCRMALKSQGSEPLVLWAMGSSEEDVALLLELLRVPERRADALWALGFSGRVSAAQACLEWMADKKLGRLAGEAFSAITGLRMEGCWVSPEEDLSEQPLPLEEDDLDADLVPRPEDDLPLPDAEAIAAWWREARGGFAQRTRYLMGHAFQGDVLLMALERGSMRRRHVWARELAIRSQGASWIATRALTRRQLMGLEQSKARGARLPASPFTQLLTR